MVNSVVSSSVEMARAGSLVMLQRIGLLIHGDTKGQEGQKS